MAKAYNNLTKWKIVCFWLLTLISQSWSADVTFLILSEKDNVQNPFVTAFEQGMSKVQTDTSSTANSLTFDQTVVVLDRYIQKIEFNRLFFVEYYKNKQH